MDDPRLGSADLDVAERLAILTRASELLASSRDLEETMGSTVGAFLPALGDFGFFDLVVGDDVRRAARAHEDPELEAVLRPTRWVRQERADLNLCALSTGKPALHREIDDAWYRAVAANDDHLAVLRQLAFGSMITVPMRYQGELLGALTMFFGRSGRRFDEDALAFAAVLANHAAPLVASTRLAALQSASAAALRSSEERLRVGMDAGRLGVWDWDIVRDAVSWSDRVYDLHGVEPGASPGTLSDFAALVHPDDRPRVREAIEAALRSERGYVVEFRVPLPDGATRWLATQADVYRDDAGRPVRMVGATYDVTERVELLARERAARAEAERARQEAESASRAKDDFLAMLGHELRNPLAPITAALGLLDLRGVTGAERERAVIRRQVAHLGRLVDDLLDVARITQGKVELRRASIDLRDVVSRAAESTRSDLEAREVALDLALGDRPAWLDGDAVRLEQVVVNLLSNAAKFSTARGRVRVELGGTEAEIELVVRDDGVGIAPELLPRVFDPFVQGPQALARERGGLGLGLAIVSSLVRLHEGRVAAESAGAGRGATFRVVLPRVRSAPPAAEGEPSRLPRGRSRVLLVDDNVDGADVLAELLGLLGFEMRVAYDGPSALAACADFDPEVAVLDIGLPGMDGYELARRLRADLARPPRLVALTGYGREGDRLRAAAAGFERHLVKPIDPAALARVLTELASRATERAGAHPSGRSA